MFPSDDKRIEIHTILNDLSFPSLLVIPNVCVQIAEIQNIMITYGYSVYSLAI